MEDERPRTARALLAIDGDDFIREAFKATLARSPDPHELIQRRNQMIAGISQRELLARLKISPEGRKVKTKVAGIWPHIWLGALEYVPLVGGFTACVWSLLTIPARRRRLDGRWAFTRHHLAQQGGKVAETSTLLADQTSRIGQLDRQLEQLASQSAQHSASLAQQAGDHARAMAHLDRLEASLEHLTQDVQGLVRKLADASNHRSNVNEEARLTDISERVRRQRAEMLDADRRMDVAFSRLARFVERQDASANAQWQMDSQLVTTQNQLDGLDLDHSKLKKQLQPQLAVLAETLARFDELRTAFDDVRAQTSRTENKLSTSIPELTLTLSTIMRQMLSLESQFGERDSRLQAQQDRLSSSLSDIARLTQHIGTTVDEHGRIVSKVSDLDTPIVPVLRIDAAALASKAKQFEMPANGFKRSTEAVPRLSNGDARPNEPDAADCSIYLDELRLPKTGHRFVDLGCGNGHLLRQVRDRCGVQVLGVDPDPEELKVAEQFGIPSIASEILPFVTGATEIFSGAALRGIVEQLPHQDMLDLIAAVGKRLVPGGSFLVEGLNPECSAAVLAFYMSRDPVRIVPWQAVSDAAAAAGLETETLVLSEPIGSSRLSIGSVADWQGAPYLKYGLIMRKPETRH